MKIPTDFLESNSNLLTTLKSKIEECIMDDKPVCVCVDNCSVTCKNRINIENYEINTDYLYLNDGNFEVGISFDKETNITYDESTTECFTITQNDIEFNLCFI